jgi:predicted RNase H-like nuclease (RuvC/YqgF family)
MKLAEILKEQGLTDEQISKITSSMKENKIYETSLENADDTYSKLKDKKEDLEGQLNTANTTIADLKKNNTDNETLQNTIKEHESTIDTLKKEAGDKSFSYALKDALKSAGCIDSKALEVYLSKEHLKLDGEKIFGLDEQLKDLKESKKYLFEGEAEPKGTGGLGGFKKKTPPATEEHTIGKKLGEQANKLQNAYVENNPYF